MNKSACWFEIPATDLLRVKHFMNPSSKWKCEG